MRARGHSGGACWEEEVAALWATLSSTCRLLVEIANEFTTEWTHGVTCGLV